LIDCFGLPQENTGSATKARLIGTSCLFVNVNDQEIQECRVFKERVKGTWISRGGYVVTINGPRNLISTLVDNMASCMIALVVSG